MNVYGKCSSRRQLESNIYSHTFVLLFHDDDEDDDNGDNDDGDEDEDDVDLGNNDDYDNK